MKAEAIDAGEGQVFPEVDCQSEGEKGEGEEKEEVANTEKKGFYKRKEENHEESTGVEKFWEDTEETRGTMEGFGNSCRINGEVAGEISKRECTEVSSLFIHYQRASCEEKDRTVEREVIGFGAGMQEKEALKFGSFWEGGVERIHPLLGETYGKGLSHVRLCHTIFNSYDEVFWEDSRSFFFEGLHCYLCGRDRMDDRESGGEIL